MGFEVKCPKCGSPTELPALLAGEQGKPFLHCEACGIKFLFDYTGLDESAAGGPVRLAQSQSARFPGYELLGVLARGGMGYVYSAVRLEDNVLCVLKVLPPRGKAHPGLFERFRREARVLRSLRHPNIIVIYDGDMDCETPYVSMPFLPGITLKRRMYDFERLPLNEIAAIFHPLSEAVEYLHRSGFIHRDLKPSNVMITMTGDVCLIDMGIARELAADSDLTEDGTNIGTPAYNAPEIFERQETSPESDQYSLAVMTFEMITGQLPMGVFSLPSLMNRELHPDSETSLLRALAHDPERRHATVQEFMREFLRPMRNYLPAPDANRELIANAARQDERFFLANPVIVNTRGQSKAAGTTKLGRFLGRFNRG